MKELRVEVSENGFIVWERGLDPAATSGKVWSFESAKATAEHIEAWGKEIERSRLMKKGD